MRVNYPNTLFFGFQHCPDRVSRHSGRSEGGPILVESVRKSGLPQDKIRIISNSCAWLKKRLPEAAISAKRETQNVSFSKKFDSLPDSLYETLMMSEVMAERDPILSRLGVIERKRVLIQKVWYWKSYLKENKIELFIDSNAPHLIDDFIIFSLCKSLGIPAYFIYRLPIISGVMSRLYVSESVKGNELLCINKSEEGYRLPADFQRLYDGCVEDGVYLSRLAKKSAWIKKDKKGLRVLDYWYRKTGPVRNIPDCKFVYFPLHYQPEASTSPLGGIWCDQLQAIQCLAESLPQDWKLLVKEHPLQRKAALRSRRFYENLKSDKKILTVDRSVSGEELTIHSEVIATVTGTAALEALLALKPAITFGNTPLSLSGSVLNPKNKTDLVDFLQAVEKGFHKVSPDDVWKSLKKLSEVTFQGYLDPYCDPNIDDFFSESENIDNVSGEICKIIESVKK